VEYTDTLAIFDPCTHFEFDEGYLHKLLENYLNKTPSLKYKFDFFFCFNRGPVSNYESLLKFESHPNINKIYLIDEKIPKEEDIYIRQHEIDISSGKVLSVENAMPEKLPPLGGASGPNLGFYLAIEILLSNYKHKNFFMLEHDSMVIKDNWFDHILEYAENNEFLIAGSKYKGHNKWHYVLNYKDHLNGIAIYKNSPELLNFIQETKSYNKKIINPSNWCVNFDILIDQFFKTNKGQSLITHATPFINTDFITNVSDPTDYYLTPEDILELHPNTLIIHQKEYQALEDWRKNYQVNIEIPKKDEDKDSCMFFLRQPRGAGNWLINCITNSVLSTPNSIREQYSLPYRVRIDFGEKMGCDIFLLADRLIHGLRKGFNVTRPNLLSFTHFKNIFAENKDFLRPFLISTIPNSHEFGNYNIRHIIFNFIKDTESWGFDYNVDLYALFRDPFDKTKSLFTEKTDNEESTKKAFIDFLNSSGLPDSFYIRALGNVEKTSEIEFFHYQEATRILDHFSIFDLSQIKEFLTTSFLKTLKINYNYSDFVKNNRFMLKSQHLITLTEDDLSSFIYEKNTDINMQEYFRGRTFFDNLLYETYIPKTESIISYYKNRSIKNNIFDFSLSERTLSIYSYIDPKQSTSKFNIKDYYESWTKQGFKVALIENDFIEKSVLYIESLALFFESFRRERDPSYEEVYSFKPLIGLAELNQTDQFYYSSPFILNKSFQSWEPDSIMHFMNWQNISFLSCNSFQAGELLEFIFNSRSRILNSIEDIETFELTLPNIIKLLKPYIDTFGWIRFTSSNNLNEMLEDITVHPSSNL